MTDDKPEGVDVMAGVIRVAPAGHVHRRVDRELAEVCPHDLKQELQLVPPRPHARSHPGRE
ncbi:hypothetical protein [Streptomyces lienomycini]|uniref:hypothetical protein n=1 Tax=Streptomyces lienomycini TaxID=284035 RepID=UPI003631B34F